jgi:hypothetical protein
MKHRRRRLVLGSTITAVVVAVIAVFIYDAVAGGVNRALILPIVIVMALIIGPLIGLFLSAPMEDGEIDDAAQARAPSRR